MKTFRWINRFALLMLLPLLFGVGFTAIAESNAPDAPQARTTPIIIDHTSTDITAIPQEWIEAAKLGLHIAYGHTSHGSQLTGGMSGLIGFADGGGLGLALPDDIFAWNEDGSGGALDLDDYAMGGDVGYYPDWVNNTLTYLGDPDPVTGRGQSHPDVNVIIWSWCGQVSGYSEQNMIDWYLAPMTQLELAYPGVTFVYMTGHADGTGEEGNLHLRNQQIRDYCIAHNKVLYDFYNIELYDPDGNYYGDKAVTDNCDYDSDGDGSRDKNWAIDWQNSHTANVDWYSCDCAHSQALNCNQKAYAVWTLWARLAGWDGGISEVDYPDLTPSFKTVSTPSAYNGDRVTYTVGIRNATGPLSLTAVMSDVIRPGLAYIPGTFTATSGEVDETQAPLLQWTGVLSPTPDITLTYAAIVTPPVPSSTVILPSIVINQANIAVPGYQSVTRSVTLRLNMFRVFLPMVVKVE